MAYLSAIGAVESGVATILKSGEQDKRIKIAAGDIDNDAIAMQASAANLKREAAEPETI